MTLAGGQGYGPAEVVAVQRWRMVVSSLGGDAVRAELTVESDNWMSALRRGRAELGEQGGMPTGSSCAVAADGTVTILDSVERRRFVLSKVAASTRPPAGLRIPADEVPRPSAVPAQSVTAQSVTAQSVTAQSVTAQSVTAQSVPMKPSSYIPPRPSSPAVSKGSSAAASKGSPTAASHGAAPTLASNPGGEREGAPLVTPSGAMAASSAGTPSTGEPTPGSKGKARKTMSYMLGADAIAALGHHEVAVGGPASARSSSAAPAAPTTTRVVVGRVTANATPTPDAPATPTPEATEAPATPTPKAPTRASEREATEGIVEGVAWVLHAARDADPASDNPLCYRERSYHVAEGVDGAAAEAVARERLDALRAALEGRPAGRFVNVAVFDHAWVELPARPPAATAMWKDWHGEVVTSRPLEQWHAARSQHAVPASTSSRTSAPAPAASDAQPASDAQAAQGPSRPKTTRPPRSVDDHDALLAEAFEACQDLFFLSTPVEGLEFATELLVQLVPHGAATACLYDIDEDVLRVVVATGPGADLKRGNAIPASAGLFGIAARLVGSTLRVDPLDSDPRFDPAVDGRPGADPQNGLYLPLAAQGRLLGVIQLLDREVDVTFSQADADLGLYVAEQVGKFLHQVRLRPRR